MSKKRSLEDDEATSKRARTFSYVYVDKKSAATATLLTQLAKSVPDIQTAYRDYLHEASLTVEPDVAHMLVMVDDAASAVVGYVLGTVSHASVHIANVYITDSLRGLGMCVPLMLAYLSRLQAVHGPIEYIDLYNAGGERSCRCYTKAFEQAGYAQKRPMDCSHPRKHEATMRASKVSKVGGSGLSGVSGGFFGCVYSSTD